MKYQISKQKLEELKRELTDLVKSLAKDNDEGTRMGGPMDSFKEAAAFQVMLGAKRLKIEELEDIISNAEILPDHVAGDAVVLGKWVDLDNGQKYRLVSSIEADPQKGLLSIDSPLGKALLEKKVGEEINIMNKSQKIQKIT